jgi:hypothetical protein
MKKNPGRKERRSNLYHQSYDTATKSSMQDGHGKPNNLHFMGVLKPTEKTYTHPLTNKRMEMLEKHPDRKLEGE